MSLALDDVRRRSAKRPKNMFTGSRSRPPTGSGNSWRQRGHVIVCECAVVRCVVVVSTLESSRQRRQNVCRQDNILGCVNISPHSPHFVNLSSPTSGLLPLTSAISPLNISHPLLSKPVVTFTIETTATDLQIATNYV